MRFRNKLFAIVLVVAIGTPSDGRAIELGMTPSDVFGLWVNIDNAILDYADLRFDDSDWLIPRSVSAR